MRVKNDKWIGCQEVFIRNGSSEEETLFRKDAAEVGRL